MSCNNEFRRMIIKVGSGPATIPVSADHRNGDWIATDIYEGELYRDQDSGIFYSRDKQDIYFFEFGHKVWLGRIYQTGTAAPTTVEGSNNYTGGFTLARTSAGIYTITNSSPEFIVAKTFVTVSLGSFGNTSIEQVVTSTSVITLTVRNSAGTLTDALLDGTTLRIETLA